MSTIFVAGPTGVLGRATIPLLVAEGHSVRALSRSAATDEAIRALGAEPVRGSLFDVESLIAATAGADAILHLATRIPPTSEVRRRDAWRENDRIRAEGTRNLVDAGIANGVGVFVYPSFAYVYPDSGDTWIDASTVEVDPVEIMQSTIAAEGEVARFAASDPMGRRRGVALRFGGLYGANHAATRELLDLARRGISSFGGSPEGHMPLLWIDDAATALVAALDRAPSGLYDVVDDDPLTHRELSGIVASHVGRRRLFSPPAWLLKRMAGSAGIALSRSLRISNRRFREAAGWAPTVPSAREGLERIVNSMEPVNRTIVPGPLKAGLGFMLLVALLGGLQQQFTTRAFYDNFPGFGMHWVSVDGPYNEHLLRDYGGANLAMAVVILFALLRPTAGLVRAVAAAVLVAQVPHFVYHAAHLYLLPTLTDQVAQTTVLALTVLVPLLVLIGARGIRSESNIAATRSATGSTPNAAHSSRLIAPAHS